MLQPKNTKFKKMQKGRNKGFITDMKISFGLFGLISISRGFISSAQIESARKVISKSMKRQGKLWIRIFPDKPITKKPLEVRMGKGKGNVENWVFVTKPGCILYEMDNISEEIARKSFKSASNKLPVKTLFIIKDKYIN